METKESSVKAAKDKRDNNIGQKRDSSWPLVLFYIHLNILGFYGVYILFSQTCFLTVIFTILIILLSVMGVTAGCHRLWAHRTYTASPALRVFLMICQTMAGHGSIYDWVRGHRLHHQTYKTLDDPYYSYKDLFSSQVLAQIENYTEKHKELLEKIDMSDIEQDKVVMFQKRFYWFLYFIFCVLLPINTPIEYWNDSVQSAMLVAFFLRYLIVLNICWLINSAHFIWGLDKDHKPSDSNLIFLITKTYWPHYHYLLPYDYQTGEFGDYGDDCTTILIRVFAALGLASNLQTVTSEAVKTGLTEAVNTDKPIVDCIREAAKKEQQRIPIDHYLDKTKYL